MEFTFSESFGIHLTKTKNHLQMKKLISIFLLSSLGILFYNCSKENNTGASQDNIDDLVINNAFNFETTKEIEISIQVVDNEGNSMGSVPIKIYSPDTAIVSDPASNINISGILLAGGFTDKSGYFNTTLALPSYMTEIKIKPGYIGLPSEILLPVNSKKISYTIGGVVVNLKSASLLKSALASGYNYLGTWNSQGVPNYLTKPRDIISSSLLADINASLPEYAPLTKTHPEYLLDSNPSNLVLQKQSDVWVTFVHEGAGWTNSLAFYTYDYGSPPATVNDIKTLTVIFPNISYSGSGGGLTSGDKVFLGNFKEGTVIAWTLIASGWSSSSKNVGNGTHKVYSDAWLNPETDSKLKKHSVLLWDSKREIYILGVEDTRRDASSDNDFNDAIFTVSTAPKDALVTEYIPPITEFVDTDKDGILDYADQYPLDPERAYNNYYPTANKFGTLAFEDMWPAKGDFDFNDLVVDYRFNSVTNASNKVVEIKTVFVLRATGASYHNGFGIQLPINPSSVKSVTGTKLTSDYINLSANGTESSQNLATIIIFDNSYDILKYSGTLSGINTDLSNPFIRPDTIKTTIQFISPISQNLLGTAPYNPFLIQNKNRKVEVHLPGMQPTAMADTDLFGTIQDSSNPAQNRYYKTIKNLPWAINLPESLKYPIEKKSILLAYPKFGEWAESGGTLYPDWYTDKTGYRNTLYIYTK